jgi:endonuclease-3
MTKKARATAPKTVPAEAAKQAFRALRRAHPDAHCELEHRSPFELIVATVLSAQSTDVAVNQVTPELFQRWPTPEALAEADRAGVEKVLGRLGMFRQKAKNVIGLAQKLCSDHETEVPRRLSQLIELPGVGRKTANVVLGVAFGSPEGVVVDTHVQRLSQRLGWTENDTPEKIERDLMAVFPRRSWDALSHTLIFHGRRICTARKPACAACPLSRTCPSAFHAEQVGRKPQRTRSAPKKSAGPTSVAARKRAGPTRSRQRA